jgi:hypothetical protein
MQRFSIVVALGISLAAGIGVFSLWASASDCGIACLLSPGR